MMGHKMRVIETDPSKFHGIQCTFGLPVPTTGPYNADYDVSLYTNQTSPRYF